MLSFGLSIVRELTDSVKVPFSLATRRRREISPLGRSDVSSSVKTSAVGIGVLPAPMVMERSSWPLGSKSNFHDTKSGLSTAPMIRIVPLTWEPLDGLEIVFVSFGGATVGLGIRNETFVGVGGGFVLLIKKGTKNSSYCPL